MRCPIVSKPYVSVCSAISSASSTSMPRYRTVLSNLVCRRMYGTPRRLCFHQEMSVAVVRLMVCVAYVAESKPIDTIQHTAMRADCRVERCGDFVTLLGNK